MMNLTGNVSFEQFRGTTKFAAKVFMGLAIGSLSVLCGCGTEESISQNQTALIRQADEPKQSAPKDKRWWAPGEDRELPLSIDYKNEQGSARLLLSSDAVETIGHPFFEALGTNGRGCVSCHQPADGMSLSSTTVQTRWEETKGKDPIFAAIDGSNCPSLDQSKKENHSLLIQKGLFRIERPWPPLNFDGSAKDVDFSIEVVRDPWGCNTGPEYGPNHMDGAGSLSVYRRPRPAANLKFLLATGFSYDPKTGMPLQLDPETGQPASGNILSDGRALSLKAQMEEAAASHLEFSGVLSEEQVLEIEGFLNTVYFAQVENKTGVRLDSFGAEGGPELLRDSKPGQLGSIGRPVWSEFEAWEKLDEMSAKITDEQAEYMKSVARGARVFREKTFLITDSSGVNSPIGFGNPMRDTCKFCHNMTYTGVDVAPGQVDLGTTNAPFADPAPDLPLFKVTCKGDPHPHLGREILTSDPGYALTTGRCADVGKITLQSLRGMSARPPYFSNGTAKDIRSIIEFYERRYNIGYTEQETQDLINLLGAL